MLMMKLTGFLHAHSGEPAFRDTLNSRDGLSSFRRWSR